MFNEEQMKFAGSQMMVFMKLMSALFDSNGGEIIVDKKIFENAEAGFHVAMEEKGDKVIFKKTNGKSKLYSDFLGKGIN